MSYQANRLVSGYAQNYGALADWLKAAEQAEKAAEETPTAVRFYERVKAQISAEIEKANIELSKRDLPIIQRIFVPSRFGKFSLTFGTSLLCNVDLEEANGRITTVILGPPNKHEIAKKVFNLNCVGDVAYPEKIAVEIIASLIIAKTSRQAADR